MHPLAKPEQLQSFLVTMGGFNHASGTVWHRPVLRQARAKKKHQPFLQPSN
jgi:hypothetical protein